MSEETAEATEPKPPPTLKARILDGVSAVAAAAARIQVMERAFMGSRADLARASTRLDLLGEIYADETGRSLKTDMEGEWAEEVQEAQELGASMVTGGSGS